MANQPNKSVLLSQIKIAAEKHMLSKSELLAAYDAGLSPKKKVAYRQSLTFAEILSLLGGGIVFFGIAVFVSQHWDFLSSLTRIGITLGVGIACYIAAMLFERITNLRMLGASFFLLSALLIPFGLGVLLNIAGFDTNSNSFYSIVSAISLVVFLYAYFMFKEEFLLIFSIVFGTCLFYSFAGLIYTYFNGNNSDFDLYCTLVIGTAYIFLARYLAGYVRVVLIGLLNGIGIFAFLGSLFALDLVHKGSIWEWIFPFVLVFVINASVRIRSVAFLSVATFFLIAYLTTITERYFSMSVGWPLALVFMGFLLITVAYFYFQMKKKYFKK